MLEAPCYSSLPSFGLGPNLAGTPPCRHPLPSLAPTLDVAVAGPAALLLMGPVEALAATFTVASVGVVGAMQAAEAVPRQPEQLPIEHALPRLAVALTHWGQDRRGGSVCKPRVCLQTCGLITGPRDMGTTCGFTTGLLHGNRVWTLMPCGTGSLHCLCGEKGRRKNVNFIPQA